MLEALTDLPSGIVGIKATGTVSKRDYEEVLEPIFAEARREGRRIKFLYQFAPEFERFTAGAAWEDMRFGIGGLRLLEGCAIVGDAGWLRESARLLGFFAPCPMRTFGNEQLDAAVEWLGALGDASRTTHRLLAETGVLIAEVTDDLTREDFEALAATADPWIESHGQLAGLVIHARGFPGAHNLRGLLGHLSFARRHDRSVRRVALVTDSMLASVVPHLVEHFVDAEVEHFEHHALERAIAWAGEQPAPDGP